MKVVDEEMDGVAREQVSEEVALPDAVLSTIQFGGPECTVLRTFRWEVLI